MKRNILKQTALCGLIFLLMTALLTAALAGAARIPKSAIRENMEESAEFLSANPRFYYLVPGIESSERHLYADCITLNIAWNYDEKAPLRSVMEAKYYTSTEDVNKSLRASVRDDLPGNKEYLRYWHGSAGAIRFLHLFWNVKQIYLFHGLLMAVLFLWLIRILWKAAMKAEAGCLVISMILVSAWFVPFCLEYTWTFLCMLAASIVGVKLAMKSKWQYVPVFFLVTGMVTVFLDFLSAETLSLVIPLLLMLRVRQREEVEVGNDAGRARVLDSEAIVEPAQQSLQAAVDVPAGSTPVSVPTQAPQQKRRLLFPLSACGAWLIGFLGMWAVKWVIASAVLHENVMPLVTGHIEERIGRGNDSLSLIPYMFGAVGRNLRCLFPLEYGIAGAGAVLLVLLLFLIIPVARDRIRIRPAINWKRVLLYAAIGCIPIIRFMVLHNHSWYHQSFTYRALAGTALAVGLIAKEVLERTGAKESSAKEREP